MNLNGVRRICQLAMKRTTDIILLLIQLVILTCAAPENLSKKELTDLFSKPAETWSFEDCLAIIDKYSTANLSLDFQISRGSSAYGKDIFIRATPFTKEVIKAIVRKESIQRRFSVKEFRKRLKQELEDFTNYSLDEQSGLVIAKPPDAENRIDEYTFEIYFLNTTDPYRTIRVYMAEEGFFLEKEDGKFTRVVGISGTDQEAYFVLYSDLYTMVTFSAFTDNGERLDFNETNMPQFRLVFTSLQREPIELDWKHLR